MATCVFAWHSNEQFIRSLFTGSYYASLLSCYAATGFVEECDFWADYNTRIATLIDFGRNTDSTGIAIYSEENDFSNPRIANLTFDSVQFAIDTLGPTGLDYSSSSFFHRNYGFAVLQVLPNNLLLARIDTAAQTVQPVGVIYESTLGTNIADADVTITDEGKVVVVWSEVSDWNDGPRTLRIAWTDWHELLDAPNEEFLALPREISLSSFPNPFNSTATIKYDLPQAGHAKLTAYDLQGRTVATLFDDFATVGSAELHWSPENLASGVYFITLEAPLARATHKILYLK